MITVSLVAASCLVPAARAQGPLTPPGAPGLTMKTLAQVEPRTPIGSAPVTLSRPGSYYLTTNLSDTVTITADNVTLDLMGFTITGPAAGGNAITLSGTGVGKNLLVHNGVVVLPTIDGVGISTIGAGNGVNGRIESLRVSGGRYGIYAGSGCTVRDCQVTGSVTGIRVAGSSIVRECRLEGNITGLWLAGTGAFVEDNIIRGNTNNFNFAAGNRLNLTLYEIPETLSWPCSVKLAGTLSTAQAGVTGLVVNADDVTFDMAGHALIGPGTSAGCGIYQSAGRRNLRVLNGEISHWRGASSYGFYADGAVAELSSVRAVTNANGFFLSSAGAVRNCQASYNTVIGFGLLKGGTLTGCLATYNDYGFIFSDSIAATDCIASYNETYGFLGAYACSFSGCTAQYNIRGFNLDACNTLSHCVAYANSENGFICGTCCALVGCVAEANGENGIYLGAGGRISESAARLNGGFGIHLESSCAVSDCTAERNTGDGISLNNDNLAIRCLSNYNGNNGSGAGFHAIGLGNRIEDNHAIGNDRGFDVDQGGNFIVRNTSRWNSPNWDVSSGNVCLVVVANAGGGAISGDSGGTSPGSADPNANFTY
jgi:hypothetical protein